MSKSLKLSLSLLPAAIFGAFLLWAISLEQLGRLPNPVATHWDITGNPDGFAALETHLVFASLAFFIPALIWLGILWYPKIPGMIRLVLLAISGILFSIMALIQISALAVQVDVLDATLARFELPFLIIFAPILILLVLFLAKPKILVQQQLSLTLRGIPIFRSNYDQISDVAVVNINWRDFGGLGLRISRGKIAFIPSSGKALEIKTRAGETILVRSDLAEDYASEIRSRMER